MPQPTRRAKRKAKNTQDAHSMSVECPKNGHRPPTNTELADRVRKLESAMKKLLYISGNLSKHLKGILRESHVLLEHHPANAEFLSWERQFNDAITQAGKTLVN